MKIILQLFAFLGLLIVSPLIFISSIFIFTEDGMPIFFIQKRIGKDEKIFKLFKIRTMRRETPSLGTHEINKNQYLKFGKILRTLKIDELPQVLNFIIGDINLVGPRPGLKNQKELLNYRRSKKVYRVKPGITGLSQVLGYDMSNPELLSKVDNLYIENKSVLLDLEIFFATFIGFFRHKLKNKFINEINEFI